MNIQTPEKIQQLNCGLSYDFKQKLSTLNLLLSSDDPLTLGTKAGLCELLICQIDEILIEDTDFEYISYLINLKKDLENLLFEIKALISTLPSFQFIPEL